MWIVLVDKDLQDSRDNTLSRILGDDPVERYLYAIDSKKFSLTYNLESANVYKRESSVIRLIERFNDLSKSKDSFYSEFYYIRNDFLSYRKLSKLEWNKIIDSKIKKEESKHSNRLRNLEKKRKEWF
jgi:hypothetical protein